MHVEIAFLTVLPIVLIVAGVLLLWSASLGRMRLDGGVAHWVVVTRWIGAVLSVIGVFVSVTYMTHGLALFFWLTTLSVLMATLHRFRDGERATLLWIIAAAAERGIPLHQAVRAFSSERQDRMRVRASRLADFLEAGLPLGLSLHRAGVRVSPAARLAVDLGQHTGTLGPALRRVTEPGELVETTLQSLVQWLLYLGFLVAYLLITITFWNVWISPKFVQIYRDFGVELPWITRWFVQSADTTAQHWYLFLPVAALAITILALAFAHYSGFSIRQLPILRRFWWRADGALILRWLAAAVRRRRPLPETIRLLAGYFPQAAVRNQLEKAALRVDRGEEWSTSLCKFGLIRKSESTLFRAAERTGNLPWALEEMAECRMRHFAYACQAYLNIAFPVLLILFGGGVLCIALAMIAPLFDLITNLVSTI